MGAHARRMKDEANDEHMGKAVSDEEHVMKEARLEELPKPSTMTSWKRLCLWICVFVGLTVVESQSEMLQPYTQPYTQLVHTKYEFVKAKMKELTMTTAEKEEQDRLDKLEQDRLHKLEQAKLKANETNALVTYVPVAIAAVNAPWIASVATFAAQIITTHPVTHAGVAGYALYNFFYG